MRDAPVGRDCEDAKGRKRPQYTEQGLRLHTACSGESLDGDFGIGRDPIGDLQVGDQAKHARDLKASQEDIQRSPVVIHLAFWHWDRSPCPKEEPTSEPDGGGAIEFAQGPLPKLESGPEPS